MTIGRVPAPPPPGAIGAFCPAEKMLAVAGTVKSWARPWLAISRSDKVATAKISFDVGFIAVQSAHFFDSCRQTSVEFKL
jgi:inner membrane protein involved in colicin E2 resistance